MSEDVSEPKKKKQKQTKPPQTPVPDWFFLTKLHVKTVL